MILSALLPLATAAAILLFLGVALRTESGLPRPGPGPQPLRFAGHCHPMERKDRLPVLLITLAYTATAFFALGSPDTPRQPYDFGDGQPVTIRILGDPVDVCGLRHFSGLGTGAYDVQISADGQSWLSLWSIREDPDAPDQITDWYWASPEGYQPAFALEQPYNRLYKWLELRTSNPQQASYLRITGRPDRELLELNKLCLLDDAGQPISFDWAMADGSPADPALTAVLTVDDAAREKPTWYNSTYFDEIYHARTAKEHIDNVYPYEVTHPPLGKLILSLGIRLFGMCPLGWRFMGTLFGVLMVPLLYILLKNMFGKTAVAACGTILFSADFMHLTQTRIATIDTYGTFFILAMYFFMYRYLTLPRDTPLPRQLIPLGLSGLMWGLGAASKWTVIYGAIGLALLYFMGFYQRLRDWGQAPGRSRWIAVTLGFSVVMFVLVPAAIYCLSYLPYVRAREGAGLLKTVWDNQVYMLTYHQGVNAAHPYSSRWYQWLADVRPILYYMDNSSIPGHTVRFAAFSNPVVCWTGLFAILICAARSFSSLRSRLVFAGVTALAAAAVEVLVDPALDRELTDGQTLLPRLVLLVALTLVYLLLAAGAAVSFPRPSPVSAFILVGWLSQLVPWMFIGRITFEYHYFPSILFLIPAIAQLFDLLAEHRKDWKTPVYGLTGLAVGCYALFYPVLIGLPIPNWYQQLLRWLPSWPF